MFAILATYIHPDVTRSNPELQEWTTGGSATAEHFLHCCRPVPACIYVNTEPIDIFLCCCRHSKGTPGRVAGWATVLQARRSRVRLNFHFNLNLPAALRSSYWVGLYQKTSTRNILLGVNSGWCIRPTASPPSVGRLFRKCRCLDVTQAYGPLRFVRRISLPFYPQLKKS